MATSYDATMAADGAANTSPYGSLMDGELQSERARVGAQTSLSMGVNPDDVAKARRTAGFLGVHPGVVEADPQSAERTARLRMLELDTAKAPTLRSSYTNADFNRLASDDSPALSGIEAVVRRMMDGPTRFTPKHNQVVNSAEFSQMVRDEMRANPSLDEATARALAARMVTFDNSPGGISESRGPAPSVGSFLRGLAVTVPAGFEQMRQGIRMQFDDLAGTKSDAGQKFQRAQNRIELATPEFETTAGKGLFGGAQSIIQNAPGVALSVMSGNPMFGLGAIGAQTEAQAYGKYRTRGATAGEALTGAVLEGGIEAATEALPMSFLVKRLGKSGAGDFLKGMLGREVPGEQLATLAQDAVDTAIANPDKTWGQYIAERPDAAWQTFVATVVQGGAMGAVNTVATRMAKFDVQAARAQETAENITALAAAASQSKLRERAPDEFNAFVQRITDSGAAPVEMFIDAQVLANTLNQSAITMAELRALSPGVAAQLEAANFVPGADVIIPVADLVAAGPDLSAALMEHLRESPDAMSQKEAQEYLGKEGERIKEETEAELGREQDAATFTQGVQEVAQQFEQELNTVGRFRPEVNKAYASMLGNFYATQAQRAGVPLKEFVQRYGLRVAATAQDGRQVVEQNGGVATNDVAGNQGGTPAGDSTEGGTKQSYLTDDRDKPLVLHHGTSADFESFDIDADERGVGGIWFSDSHNYAYDMAGGGWNIPPSRRRKGRVISARIRAANPKTIDVIEEGKRLADEIGVEQPTDAAEAQELLSGSMSWDRVVGDMVSDAKREGHDALVIKNFDDGRVVTSTAFVVFSPDQIEQIKNESPAPDGGGVLNQGARAQLSFFEDITAMPSVITLNEGADLSSFLHETGHFFLEVQADLASRIQSEITAGNEVTETERRLVSDMDALLSWFGVKGTEDTTPLTEWLMMPLEQKREHHETFARGFERYTMEGKAPTLELAELFQKFRAWLVSVYKTLAGLNVKLTDDVRAVMGRMLATDQAIQIAQDARGMSPMIKTPEDAAKFGMTDGAYAEYQALGERATMQADAELDARLMKDLKWLSRARDKAIKAQQAEADALRKEVEREVRAEVMSQPVYQAWQFLTGKVDKVEAGTRVAEDVDTVQESGRLRTNLVKDMAPEAFELIKARRMTNAETGMHPDIVAEMFPGFESGQQLINALAASPPPAEVIAELTDQRMLERHGDIATQEAMDRAADEAVHNELRARVIAAELKALNQATTQRGTSDDLLARRDTVDVMTKAAKEYADAVIARQRIKDLRPKKYAAAEARSAKLAEKAMGKDLAEAAMHKRNQLVNNLATKASCDAQAEVKKGIEFMRKIVRANQEKTGKTRDWGTVQAAKAILAEYGVGERTGKRAQDYLQTVAENDPGMYTVLKDRVDALTVNARPINELTVEEFRGLEAELQSLWHLSKRSRQVEVDGNLIDIEDAKIPLVERMEAIGIPARVPGEGSAVTDTERRLATLKTLRAALRRVESWVGTKDGGDKGPFRTHIWQPIKDAADAYRTDKAKYIKRYKELLSKLDVGRSQIEAPELGYVFGKSRGGSGKAEILHAILHTGNASNMRKLLLGRGWATDTDGTLDTARWDRFVQRMIDTGVLTKADFDFAQGVWDLLEDTKPLAQKAHRDVFGRYFEEVTADGFTNQFGAYRGGYVPAMMDPEVVKDAQTRALQEDENQTLAYAFPTTAKGFTKARVEHNRPLLLDLRTLSTHIDKVLLFSHMEQPIRDVRKILTSKDVSEPLHRIDSAAYDSLLTPWMNRAARQTVEVTVPGYNNVMRFFSIARSRAGMAAMMANVVNTAQQITGFSMAAVKVPPKHLLSAAADWVMSPRKTTEAVASASQYMASRMDNEVHQMTGAIDDILLNPSVYEKAQNWTAKHAYFMQAAVDNVMGPIIWNGAYNQAVERGDSDRDAIRYADSVVRETQGSNLPEDVANFEEGSAFKRMFVQFAGYFNMQANLLGTEFSKGQHELGLRSGMGRGLYVFTFGFLVPAMVSELIVQAFRGGPDDEDKDGSHLDDWLMAVLVMGNIRAGLGMLPVAGPALNAGINTFNSKPYDDRISTSPAVSMIESAVSAPASLYRAVMDDGNRRKAVRDLATLISMTTGLPANAIARPVGYLAGVDDERIDPTSGVDAARGLITGVPSPDSRR